MIPVVTSLDSVSTRHAVFEKNQVLTHEQLNSVATYADDQLRLSRTQLTGVGVVHGLRARAVGEQVTLSPGVGLTTDGDLVNVPSTQTFTAFRALDTSRPLYAPFLRPTDGGEPQLYPIWELLTADSGEPDAKALAGFAAAAGFSLDQAVALIWVESYHHDEDLCSGTDCDNLGQEARHSARLLLVSPKLASRLHNPPRTAHAAFAATAPVAVTRPVLSAAVAGPRALWEAFAGPIRAAAQDVSDAAAAAWKALAPFVPDAFDASPVEVWAKLLAAAADRYAPSGSSQVGAAGYVYAYDWLKDLADTLNSLRDAVLDDQTWHCTDPGRFPKHLLLGGTAAATADTWRTPFTPSPAASPTATATARARFLLRKLDAQLRGLSVNPSARAPIRATPSAGEDQPLEERAIPCYYTVSAQDAAGFPALWSYRLHRRSESLRALGYHAGTYNRDPAVSAPLTVQHGGCPFYRVEGHIGWDVDNAKTQIDALITAHNLSFAVELVYIGTDPLRLRPRPRPYTDLHRLHKLFRKDIEVQLGAATVFGDRLEANVKGAVEAATVSSRAEDNEGVDIRTVATTRNAALKTQAQAALPAFSKSYSAFRMDTSWKSPLTETLRVAGEFKNDLSPVAKTEFQTPLDTLIAAPQLNWLDWIGEIIEQKQKKLDQERIITRFLTAHPGAEHLGGVPRGGTLILVYGDDDAVIADLALPYRCCAEVDEEEDEPVLTLPTLRPTFVLESGVRVKPSVLQTATGIADLRVKTLSDAVTLKISAQDQVLDIIKTTNTSLTSSFTNMTTSYTDLVDNSLKTSIPEYSRTSGTEIGLTLDDMMKDPLAGELDMRAAELEYQDKRKRYLRAQRELVGDDTAKKAALDQQIRTVEEEMAATVSATAETLAKGGETLAGTAAAGTAVSRAEKVMTGMSADAAKTVTTAVTALSHDASTPKLNKAFNRILKIG